MSSTSVPLCSSTSGDSQLKPTMFEKMASIQEEIAQIDSRLRSLRAAESVTDAPLTSDVGDDVEAPVVHMLSVELCQLAASGDTVGVRILLNCGADCDSRDYDERTPLHIASAQGHVQVVRLLLSFGADDTLTDNDDKTALQLAEENDRSEVVQLLLAHSTARHEVDLGGRADVFSMDSPFTPYHPDFSQLPQPMMGSLIVIMVGLSGRGKTYIARQIQRYFQWNGLQSKIFTYSDYRRKLVPGDIPYSTLMEPELESRVATDIAHDMVQYIAQTDSVAVMDGTNCAPLRRLALIHAIQETGLIRPNRVVFVEVINNDAEQVQQNVNRMKEMYPDTPDTFVEEFYARIEQQKETYRSLNPDDDTDLTYICVGEQTIYSLNNVFGWMPSRLAYLLHNLSHAPANLYLTRAGEYVDLVAGRIGGNSHLTERGKAYSEALFNYFQKELQMNPFIIMSSCALRCTETVQLFEERGVPQQQDASSETAEGEGPALNCRVAYLPTLDNINHGDCDGQLLSDVRKTMPSTLKQMQADPYYTAWPNGECTHQMFNARLEPHIHDIQASADPVLVVSHLQLLQGLYSYFVPEEDNFVAPQNAYEIDIPFECVIKIRLVGVNRVAETIDLSKQVDEIALRRTGNASKAPQLTGMNYFRKLLKK
ncbi:6-phosphofructo-2-kinase/fructose-2,6-biphosphatase [Trypanosoma grayi]|uniref:6-phosphofructo-2-kinase/fructose-2, 6-biphosphatase n=1 Tax=Trypanosoma grayi TaxID=71804 RepID=UPI0004F3F5DF|nr:6-phosphofructo-2-kinase/fructose-2,6-biphosphatase [Trypanosoma grayi]KEG06121.1 6-phosphofructo-2-kinase/fructose-2,6-biphosphatase [Trypanosoma grayi]